MFLKNHTTVEINYLKNMYDLVNYWNLRAEPNSKTTTENKELMDKHINYLKKYTKKNSKVLDIGPGVGRLSAAFDKTDLSIYDISDKYLPKLNNELSKYDINIKNIHISKKKWRKLPFGDDEFDIVTCSLVLLHQEPKYIEDIMIDLARVGKKVVCISSINGAINPLADHVFDHDYEKILIKNSFKFEILEISDINQIYFTYEK